MHITPQEKNQIFEELKIDKKDTGGPVAQIVGLTSRIRNLTTHLTTFSKDKHSRRGLIALISNRKRNLLYLSRKNRDLYLNVLKVLNIRK